MAVSMIAHHTGLHVDTDFRAHIVLHEHIDHQEHTEPDCSSDCGFPEQVFHLHPTNTLRHSIAVGPVDIDY